MKRITENQKLTLQVILASILVLSGLVLLFFGFYAVPIGEISASVLTAYGETATFAGALLGLDYNYKFKIFQKEHEKDKDGN